MENSKLYITNKINYKNQKDKLSGNIRRIVLLRLFTFLFFGGGVLYFWGNGIIVSLLMIFGLGLFLILVSIAVSLDYQKKKLEELIRINEQELSVLSGNWSHFNHGVEYEEKNHAYTRDLDVFGPKGLFQLVNRTVSKRGAEQLANNFKSGIENVKFTNEMIKALHVEINWMQEFIAEGRIFDNNSYNKDLNNLNKIEIPPDLYNHFGRFIMPILTISFGALYFFGLINFQVFSIVLVLHLALIGYKYRRIGKVTNLVSAHDDQMKAFKNQILLLKKLNLDVKDFHSFNSDLVNNEHGFLAALNDYFVLLKRIEYRNNYLVNILLNLTLGWDQHLVRQVKFWKIKYGNHLGEWQNKLSQFEVWISGAIYYYNFPKSCFAQYNESNIVEIDGLVHPFLQFKMNAQFNNCSISENQHFIIITGPNMAGKSTYLRSVGTAFFLANAGFPIAAKSCSIPRCKLFTSMRTADDLNEGNSYFFAELSRLKLIVNEMENGNRLFVILDEILKGTNSRDKEMGSAKFLQKLNTLGGKGLIATHDLSLCELANDSGSFINRYFDSKIIDQKLSFDYKIYNGVCQNMNATFLLKSMNLID